MTTLAMDWDHIGGYGPEQIAGHSGSETSETAARRPKGKRMKAVLEHLEDIGPVGSTCREVENFFDIDHGAASGALTRLHRAGYTERLTEVRDGQQVYVALEHAEGREVSPYRPNAAYREDRSPMPLERPEPTLESIRVEMRQSRHPYGGPAFSVRDIEILAPEVLRIVRKYR